MVPEASSVGDTLVEGGASADMSAELADDAPMEQSSNTLPTSPSRARSSSRPNGSAGDAESLPSGAAVIAVAGLQGATIARPRVASRPRSLSRPRVANLGGASTEITVLAPEEGSLEGPAGADNNDAEGHGASGHSEAM